MSYTFTSNAQLACPCCTGAIRKCFQLWTAVYNCDLETWTLTPGAKVCLPTGTSAAWFGSACSWQRYVPMGDTACTTNAVCVALANTAEPPPPFAGEPPNCCNCIEDCGCFTVGRSAAISFAGVLNGMVCIECVLGAGSSQFFKAGTGTLGTYTLTRSGACTFSGIFSGVTYQTATGPTGGGCPPDGDFSVVDDGFEIDLSFDGVTTWTLSVRGPEFGAYFIANAEQGDCDAPLVFTNTIVAYNPCAGVEDLTKDGTATVVFTPCVPI